MSLKKWLSKTGIYEKGQEIIDEINPLKAVIEHPRFPLARIYRTSFWRGIADTYNVLVGLHYHPMLNGRKGVLDLFIFPLIGRICLSYALFLLADIVNHGEEKISLVIPEFLGFLVLIAIGAPLALARNFLGIVLTLVLTPVVAIVHGITHTKSKQYREDIEKLEVTFKNGDVSELRTSKIEYIKSENDYLELGYSSEQGFIGYGHAFIMINAKNVKGIKALLAINSGQIITGNRHFYLYPSEERLRYIEDRLKYIKENKCVALHWMAQLKMDCKAKNESIPPADYSQFANMVNLFAGIDSQKNAQPVCF